MEEKLGRWAFILGVIIAILLGFVTFSFSTLILVILGLLVGFLNVTEKETDKFLIATIALIVVGVAGLKALDVFGSLSTWVASVLTSYTIFVAAAAVVVAIKALFETGKRD